MSFNRILSLLFVVFLFLCQNLLSQSNSNKQIFDPELNILINRQAPASLERSLRYRPDGEDFVIVNGRNKFNRALYGTHSGFRVETGDVPEFAFYLPGMGGNLSFSLGNKTKTISLNNAETIECRYRPGARIYNIIDPLLGKGKIVITALAMSAAEGLILKVETKNIPSKLNLSWVFGGASGKRFSRNGDLGVDPINSFELKPEYCTGNVYTLNDNTFHLLFGAKKNSEMIGTFPPSAKLTTTNAEAPVLKANMKLKNNTTYYIGIQIPSNVKSLNYASLPSIFSQSETDRAKLASRIKINTPDPYFNTLGGTLAVAADGIWSGDTWLHGAVGWRMPLSGWRAAYTGDVLGWHDRARTHFDAYAASQVVDVAPIRPHPSQDSVLNLARADKTWGTQMYSTGYICRNPNENNRMHHYNMNLCYIDQLFWHLNWTGDLEYAKKIWPVIARSLVWEKRNYDPDNDGLYDAYACIWASDALYYNSGAVTHSTAYNYRANKLAAMIAEKIGVDAMPYLLESKKIIDAVNARLWIAKKGHWAEFQDFMGAKKLHESAAIWTIYHAIDSDLHDAFQGYQATRYIDAEIPQIPVVPNGLDEAGLYTISTTNWLPYSWSINNVAFAEVMHTSLAYWQAGRNEAAFNLLKSSVLDGMYLGASPGNIGQISYYDAARGECYRDFGDPIGVASRALVEGLFGITPDAMNQKLVIRPGFPAAWNHASIAAPYLDFAFKRNKNIDTYSIKQQFKQPLNVKLQVKALSDSIVSVTCNGKSAQWTILEQANVYPIVQIEVANATNVEIVWGGKAITSSINEYATRQGQAFEYVNDGVVANVYDPQSVVADLKIVDNKITGTVKGETGYRTIFAETKRGQMKWWRPINVYIEKIVTDTYVPFTNLVAAKCETINIDNFFNDSVTNVFKNKYLSPRSPFTTLQIPTQGIGEWCHPNTTADIDDSGMRKLVANNVLKTSIGIPFRMPADGRNIVFTTLWDNFPNAITLPLSGSASNAYLLMAGTTNHMQCHFVNGRVVATYTDGSADTLELINPDNWCPIEQDFFVDGKAFKLNTPRHYRLHLKTGMVSNNLEKELGIDGVYGRRIDGGAGVLIDMPLDKSKTLKSLTIETCANDVVIGLMSITLQR